EHVLDIFLVRKQSEDKTEQVFLVFGQQADQELGACRVHQGNPMGNRARRILLARAAIHLWPLIFPAPGSKRAMSPRKISWPRRGSMRGCNRLKQRRLRMKPSEDLGRGYYFRGRHWHVYGPGREIERNQVEEVLP